MLPIRSSRGFLAVLASVAVFPLSGNAITTLDLASHDDGPSYNTHTATQPLTTSGMVNGATYQWNDPTGSSGSGTFDPFIRFAARASGIQSGYNSDGRPPAYHGNKAHHTSVETNTNFNHSVLIGDMPIVWHNGSYHIEVFLDINESQSHAAGFISLDELKVFESPHGSHTSETHADLGTLRYDLDAGWDPTDSMTDHLNNEVLLYTFNGGSGAMDYRVLIPIWDEINPFHPSFEVSRLNNYFTFYTSFGASTTTLPDDPGGNSVSANWDGSAGFEEWSFSRSTARLEEIPEPSSFTLLGLVFAGLFGYRTVRKRRATAAR